MFTAKRPDGSLIHAAMDTRGEDRVCPECGEIVILKASSLLARVSAHYAHSPSSSCARKSSGGPSDEHTALQIGFADKLLKTSGVVSVAVEDRLELSDGRHRVADVSFLRSDGSMGVVEIQLSHQTDDEFVSRTEDYFKEGIDCWWVVGRSKDAERLQSLLGVSVFVGRVVTRTSRDEHVFTIVSNFETVEAALSKISVSVFSMNCLSADVSMSVAAGVPLFSDSESAPLNAAKLSSELG